MFAIKQEPVQLDGSKIDWLKVIENLREQSNYYAGQANEYMRRPGFHESSREMRASANIASSLASALAAGLSPIGPSKDSAIT